MKLLILTAEPKNFVPVELEKAAIAKSVSTKIVDIRKIVIQEALEGKLYVMEGADEDAKLVPLEFGPDTVVIPRLNEYHLDTKISILQRMENAGCIMVNSSRGMSLCNDKLMSQVVLNNAGVRTPKSWVIQDAHSFDTVIKLMEEMKLFEFPIIVKTFRGTHGIGVMKLDSRSSLVSVGQTLLKEGIDFMLQEFAKHDKSVRIIMKGQELLASNLRGQPKAKDEFRTNSHLGSETQPNVPSETEMEMARKIVTLFGTNFCAIDYILIEKLKEGYTKGDQLPVDVADGHIHWQTFDMTEDVRPKDRLLKKTNDRWHVINDLTEETKPEIFDKEILVLEVNGSPGLEAISKNWPDKNLAAEVIDFASSLLQPKDLKQQAPEEATVELPPEEQPADAVNLEPVEDRLNFIETAQIHVIMKDAIEAKVDTGATTSSLHVDSYKVDGEAVQFKRGDTSFTVPLHYLRHVKNNAGGDSSERPVVLLDITVKGKRFNRVAFSLNNRGHMKYEILIGRNLIELIGLPVEIQPQQDVGANLPAAEIEEE